MNSRPSVCLSSVSVTLVRPTQAVEIFGNISTAFDTLTIDPLTPTENFRLRTLSQGTLPPGPGELYTRGVAKYSDSGPIEGYISETVQDRKYISINHSQEVTYELSIGTKIDDLE